MANKVVELKSLYKTYQDNEILHNIQLEIVEGEFLTLLGPSGCGKTTLLRLISGFEEPSAGTILIDGKDVKGLPPSLRHVHTVFQSYALFPHMTVWDNIAFGLRCQRLPEAEIKPRVEEVLRMVKLERFAQRKPDRLSGGQQQRVAIARAAVNQPRVLLLDEPLSSLDYRLRKNMQIELKQLQRNLGITFVFVTHDQEEALSMSDRVVVMMEGCIEQVGTPREVYEKPQSLNVAKFIGEVNIFEGLVETSLSTKEARITVLGKTLAMHVNQAYQPQDKVHVIVRPEDLRVWDDTEVDDTADMFRGTVEEVIYKGTTVDLMVRLENSMLVAATEFFNEDDANLDYSRKEKVWVHWMPGWEVVLPYEQQ